MDDGPILIWYDGSEGANRAIKAAAGLLTERRAIVLDVPAYMTLEESVGTVGQVPVNYEELNREAALDRANAGAKIAQDAGFDAAPRVEFADPTWEGVIKVADEIGAAVIVIAGSGLSGLTELVKGKVPRTVAEHAGRPVLLVPPPH